MVVKDPYELSNFSFTKFVQDNETCHILNHSTYLSTSKLTAMYVYVYTLAEHDLILSLLKSPRSFLAGRACA